MTERNQPLTQILINAATEHSKRNAIWDHGVTTTYDQLYTGASELASKIDRTIAPGLSVALLLPRCTNSFTGLLAALLSNRAYVPLNIDFPQQRLLSICGTAQIGIILVNDETALLAAELVPSLSPQTTIMHMSGKVLQKGADGNLNPQEPDTAYMMFTSGTTGIPKGVRVTQENVCAYLESVTPIAGLMPDDRTSQFIDHYFDLSVHDIFLGLSSGSELSILPKSRMIEVAQFVRERELTTWCSVPSLTAHCERVGHLTAGSIPSLRLSVFCGEALSVQLARKFADAAPNMKIVNLYGPTEATVALTAYEINDFSEINDLATVPLGWPMGKQSWLIGDGKGGEGEIIVGGSQVAAGYINDPKQNAEKFFVDGLGVRYYRTGDLGRPSEKFGAVFISRIDDQVKVNGYRIELLEVDAAVSKLANASQVASIPWSDGSGAQATAIVSFVVDPQISTADIRRRCRELLPTYMVPRRVLTLDEMPLATTGKIDRKKLAEIATRLLGV